MFGFIKVKFIGKWRFFLIKRKVDKIKKNRLNIVRAKNNLIILFIGISFWIICNMRGIIFWMNFWKKIILNENI